MSGTVRNVAKGNARVGVQAHTVHGGISIGGPAATGPESWDDLLADLRDHLRKAQEAGLVDPDTCTAAEQELDTVANDLPPSGEEARSRVLVALRKLRGLLLDWTDLASKVTALIAAVRGIS